MANNHWQRPSLDPMPPVQRASRLRVFRATLIVCVFFVAENMASLDGPIAKASAPHGLRGHQGGTLIPFRWLADVGWLEPPRMAGWLAGWLDGWWVGGNGG